MHVDVLVFGPHPDDIEIGLGATVAKHVDLGYRVGLCDLTRGELGSNGTVEERAAEGATWKPEWVCHYFINDAVEPSFVIDVSDAYPRKQQALECHRSQFRPVSDDAVPTRLTGSGFRRMIEARDAHLGALAGVAHAEGVIVKAPVERPTLFRGVAGMPRTPRSGRTR